MDTQRYNTNKKELIIKSSILQNLGKVFDSFVMEQQRDALAIKTAEFELP